MTEQQGTSVRGSVVEITDLAILSGQFPFRLKQLGFRMIQAINDMGHDLYHYVLPPVCEVPAGFFLMGSNQNQDLLARDNEIPQYQLHLATFQIGMYPVTVAEYACAITAGAVQAPQHIDILTDANWAALQLRGKALSWQMQQHHLDHPVVCITWFEANAYAAWLAHVTQQPWRLPTEAEWEKAARGTDGRIYPWGNRWDTSKANTTESGPKMTTPVGSYVEHGDASPYQVHDLAGNVREWTSSLYRGRPPYRRDQAENDDETDITADRVLRGGSWIRELQHARVAFREKDRLHSYYYGTGVRLALSVASGVIA